MAIFKPRRGASEETHPGSTRNVELYLQNWGKSPSVGEACSRLHCHGGLSKGLSLVSSICSSISGTLCAPFKMCPSPTPSQSYSNHVQMCNTSGSSNPSPTSLPLVLPVLGSRTHKRGAFFLAGVRHHFLLLLSFRSCCSKTGLTNTGKNCDQSPVIYTLK